MAIVITVFSSGAILAGGNEKYITIDQATTNMFEVYKDHQRTLYCDAQFNEDKKVTYQNGFIVVKYIDRASIAEAEHIFPLESVSHKFEQWHNSSPECVNSKKKQYKGQECVIRTSYEFGLIASDLHNMAPVIGSVNAARRHFPYTRLSGAFSSFGTCDIKIAKRLVQPPEKNRGLIARAMLYMEQAYPQITLRDTRRNLMNKWSEQFHVTRWECERNIKISKIQGNTNPIVDEKCKEERY